MGSDEFQRVPKQSEVFSDVRRFSETFLSVLMIFS